MHWRKRIDVLRLLPLLLFVRAVTKQRRQTFVSGINSLRGTLPWIAPEIVKHPETVTEKVSSMPARTEQYI
jgi:hypothetical protein